MSDWVLILGCSTGHGGATAKRLAKVDMVLLVFTLIVVMLKKMLSY